MRNIICFLLAGAALLLTGPVFGQTTQLTIYRQGLAWVRQTMTVPIHRQKNQILVPDVAVDLLPGSVRVHGIGAGPPIHVLEQRFEYDLFDMRRMLKACLGRSVQLISEDAELVSGELLRVHGNLIVLRTAAGIRALPLDERMSVRVEDVPDRLFVNPTLIWDIAPYPLRSAVIELDYLTRGMQWQVDYSGVLNAGGTAIDLDAWVTVDNQSGADFPDAKLHLVAGDLHRAPPAAESRKMVRATMAAPVAADAAEFAEKSLFEYHLYSMDRPVTLEKNQSKQMRLFSPVRLPAQKVYRYDARKDPDGVEVQVRFQNESTDGKTRPLPAGVLRIYQQDAEDIFWVGEDRIAHIPADENVEISTGKAFDLAVEKKIMTRTRLTNRSERQEIRIELHSAKKEAVDVSIDEYFHHQQWKIEKSNVPVSKKQANLAAFRVPVEAGGKSVLNYTVVFSW